VSDLSATPDDVAIVIDNNRYAGWQSIQIMRSAEAFPNSFSVTGTEAFPYDAKRILIQPGAFCQVFIGSDLVITGYVDRYEMHIGPRMHSVMITGRGLCEDLVDCSVDLINPTKDLRNGMVNASNALDLATKLAKPFEKIKVRSAVSDLGQPIPFFQIMAGETAYEVIERVARYAGYLVYEDENGAMVLDRVGTKEMASGFVMSAAADAQGNIESAAAVMSIDQLYSVYCVVWTAVNTYSDLGNAGYQRYVVADQRVPRYRPKIIVSEQIVPDFDFGKKRGDWERARRFGRSSSVSLSCDSWRDSKGNLWTPNQLAVVDAPALKLDKKKWIIGTVVFRKDLSGTHADIVLMPPDAFDPVPVALNLYDRELTQGSPKSQNPPEPQTSNPTGGAPT
jgi:prophage tail gpP-like protein